jgi:hypothetical protein
LGTATVWACRMFGTQSIILAHGFAFNPIFGHSNALRRTFTGSTLPFAVACASSVRRKSDVDFRRDFDDPDQELFAVLSTRLIFGFDALGWRNLS